MLCLVNHLVTKEYQKMYDKERKVMTILHALGLQKVKSGVVSLVGAGGKTTCMFRLAHELKKNKKNVLVTTTTKIYHPQNDDFQYDSIYIGNNPISLREKIPQKNSGFIAVAAKRIQAEQAKLVGFNYNQITSIHDETLFDFMLIEADGAGKKSIKAPDCHEPVVPRETSITIGMIGFDCLGKPVEEKTVHRLENFCDITGTAAGNLINKNTILQLIESPLGLFKKSPKFSSKILILNQVDTAHQEEKALSLAEYIKEHSAILDKILIARLNSFRLVRTVIEVCQNHSNRLNSG